MPNRFRVFLPFLGVALAVFAAGAVSAAPFVSAKGYRITPPPGWRTLTSYPGTDVVFIAAPQHGFASNINVVITPASTAGVAPGTLLKQVCVYATGLLSKQFTHYKLLSQRSLTCAAQPAYETVATYQLGTPAHSVEGHQVYILKGGHCYIFTLTALSGDFAQVNPALMTSLHTLHWTK